MSKEVFEILRELTSILREKVIKLSYLSQLDKINFFLPNYLCESQRQCTYLQTRTFSLQILYTKYFITNLVKGKIPTGNTKTREHSWKVIQNKQSENGIGLTTQTTGAGPIRAEQVDF